MAIYEYECLACGHTFEEWQKISDPPVTDCPKCGEPRVQRLISRSSFMLKGGGWYADGYNGKGATSSSPSKSNGSSGGNGASKSNGSSTNSSGASSSSSGGSSSGGSSSSSASATAK